MTAKTLFAACAIVFLSFFSACSSSGKRTEEYIPPRVKWYAHCETCDWCKGAFKSGAEAQRVVSEHNIQRHDWIKVAYYDQVSCSK